MKALTAAFKLDGRTFIEIVEPIVQSGNIKPGQLFVPELAANGDIVLRRAEENKP